MTPKLPPGQSLVNVPVMLAQLSPNASDEEKNRGDWLAWSTAAGWPGDDHVHGQTPTEALRAALKVLSDRVTVVEASASPSRRERH